MTTMPRKMTQCLRAARPDQAAQTHACPGPVSINWHGKTEQAGPSTSKVTTTGCWVFGRCCRYKNNELPVHFSDSLPASFTVQNAETKDMHTVHTCSCSQSV